jgi:hypothetical protein
VLSPLVWLQIFVFGAFFGPQIEFVFTAARSLLKGNLKLTASTYGWMPPIYGATVVVLHAVHEYVHLPTMLQAGLYTGVFFGAEAVSGLAIKHLTAAIQARWPRFHGGGVVPWEYEKSAWAPGGLVNFKYLPYWYILGLCFDPIADFFQRVAVFLAGP